jgi:hypothetical protein
LENNIPSSPAELLAMQQGGIKEEINREDINALDELIRGEVFPELNPDMSQVLVLTKRLLEDIESYHFNALDDGDLSPQQKRIWKRDAKKVTEALMALRQVAEG